MKSISHSPNPNNCNVNIILIPLSFISLNAFSNNLPSPDIELRHQQEQLQLEWKQQGIEKKYTSEDDKKISIKEIPREMQCVEIKYINIIENTINNKEQIISILNESDSPIGKCVGEEGLMIILQRVNNELIKEGFITSKSEIKEYTPATGILSIAIRKGTLEKYSVTSETKTTINLKTIFPGREGEAINLRDLEQGLDNIQNLTGSNAEFTIQPGKYSDSSLININHPPSQPINLSANINNFGNEQTGKFQSSLGFRFNSPTGLSDHLYLAINQDVGNKKPSRRGTKGWEIQYAIPFKYWQFGGLINNRKYEQSIKGYSQDYLYHGQSEIFELYANNVFYRSTNQKTSFQFKVYSHRSRNFIDDTEILVQRRQSAGWEWQLQHQQLLPNHILNGSLTYRRGTAAFGALPAPEEKFNEGSARMEMYDLDFQWETQLPISQIPIRNTLRINAQWSPEPLTSQDRICLGSSNSIRAFYGQYAKCGDNGIHLQNELGIHLAGVETYLGVDWGKLGGPSLTTKENDQISGLYLGIKGRLDKYLFFNTFIGKPVKYDPGLAIPKSVFGFSITTTY